MENVHGMFCGGGLQWTWVKSYREINEENGAITNKLAITIDLIKVSPTGYNSHYRKSKQDRPKLS